MGGIAGPARDDIRPGMRYLVASDHVVLYRFDGVEVHIVRIVHGKRDLAGVSLE